MARAYRKKASDEQLKRLTALWKDIEDISTHARSQLEVKLHSYSELNAYVKRITADLKRIKAMLDY